LVVRWPAVSILTPASAAPLATSQPGSVSVAALAHLVGGVARTPELWRPALPPIGAERTGIHLLETAYTVSKSVSDGSRCQTRLKTQSLSVPS